MFVVVACGGDSDDVRVSDAMPEVRSLEHVPSVTEVFERPLDERPRDGGKEFPEKLEIVGCTNMSLEVTSGALVGFWMAVPSEDDNRELVSARRYPFTLSTTVKLGESVASLRDRDPCVVGPIAEACAGALGALFGHRSGYDYGTPRPVANTGCRPDVYLFHRDKQRRDESGRRSLLRLESDLLVMNRRDGGLEWRGVVRDDKGRPTEVWTEEPEPELYDDGDWVDAQKSPPRGWNPVTGCGENDPFRPLSVEAWAPKRSASVRLRWYEHVDVPAEVWTEADQVGEGMYVAFGDDGLPLVVGWQFRGLRHGPWYYFGWREDEGARRATLVRIERWVVGRVASSWDAGPDEVVLGTEGDYLCKQQIEAEVNRR